VVLDPRRSEVDVVVSDEEKKEGQLNPNLWGVVPALNPRVFTASYCGEAGEERSCGEGGWGLFLGNTLCNLAERHSAL